MAFVSPPLSCLSLTLWNRFYNSDSDAAVCEAGVQLYSCTVVQLEIVHNFIYFRVDYMIIYSRVDLFWRGLVKRPIIYFWVDKISTFG